MNDMADVLRRGAYPLTMILTGLGCVALLDHNQDLLVASYLPVILGAVAIVALERAIPYRLSWRPDRIDVFTDGLFMLVVQVIVPRLLGLVVALALLDWYRETALGSSIHWPQQWGLWPQVIFMILCADFTRYWLHRASHAWPPLWRLHAVHHSPHKLYWFNVGRFHPLEEVLQFTLDALPFILLAVDEKVLALYFVLYAVNGFFQHSNVDVRLGWLNYLISGPELHRWHHSVRIRESDRNFGNNLIVWDLVFGTRYLPRERAVGELGLRNRHYPLSFASQLWTPFAGRLESVDLPVAGPGQALANCLLGVRMLLLRLTHWRRFMQATRAPEAAQRRVLARIVADNRDTAFGRDHAFAQIRGYTDWARQVPVSTWDDLARYRQGEEIAAQGLTRDPPVIYQTTSGTTGAAKYLPVTARGLRASARQQQLFALARHLAQPNSYTGKVFAMASPAIEGRLPSGLPYGSASGLLYRSMPPATRHKYVVPWPLFEIPDYETKYRALALLAAANPSTTAAAAANPSTFVRLLEVLNAHRDSILAAIEHGAGEIGWLAPAHRAILAAAMIPDPALARRLRAKEEITFRDIWPQLQMLATWTGGSCGTALSSLRPALPDCTRIVEMGYLASEFRGTITLGVKTGVPTLCENFFEFIEPHEWDGGPRREFLRLHELEQGKQYYVIVTTVNGLYRYFINDIVQVDARFGATATLQFVQKGKGVTSITGEKLYEQQVIAAVAAFEALRGTAVRFYQVLADVGATRYRLFLEAELDPGATAEYATEFDELLAERNAEYRDKRASNRIGGPIVRILRPGTSEAFKASQLERGQREGQFKTLTLAYVADMDFPFDDHSLQCGESRALGACQLKL